MDTLPNKDLESLKNILNLMKPKNGIPCTYCGILATDKEHVTPISWIESLTRMKEGGVDVKIPEIKIVPSCRECNLIASDKVFSGIREKRLYIRKRLEKRYHRFIIQKPWTDEEIMELDGRLREYVFIYNEVYKTIRKRLKWSIRKEDIKPL